MERDRLDVSLPNVDPGTDPPRLADLAAPARSADPTTDDPETVYARRDHGPRNRPAVDELPGVVEAA